MNLKIQLINYLFIIRKKIEINLDNINFNVVYSSPKYILIILNNFRKGKEIDLNISTIRNTPLQFLYSFENIDVKKFNGQYQLKSILNNFTINQENPLNFNINKYMNKQQVNFNQYNITKYIRVNDHFFTYYNNDPLKKNHHIECLFMGTSITVQIGILTGVLQSLLSINDDDSYADSYLTIVIQMRIFYAISILIGLCICKCRNLQKCLRIDIIYSFDFDKIFIGTSINDKKRYITASEFFINEIDRFILKKNKISEKGFHLNAISKGNMYRELCFIKGEQEELEGLVYILNEKVEKKAGNNNVEQQRLGECPPPITTT